MEVTDAFRELMTRPEAEVPLDEAALLIARHAHPGVVEGRYLGELDRFADGCPSPTLDGLVDHLFGDLGFRGNRDRYYDPANSYLHTVIENRRGIPISLSVMVISVGRRLGVPLVGIGMPGHFLVRDQVDPSVYVDAFEGGRILDVAGCADTFHQVQGDEAPFDRGYLRPVGTFAILARMLANLRAVFAATSDHRSLLWVMQLRLAIPGVPPEERGELAGALAATGDFYAAAREFETLGDALGGVVGDEYLRHASQLRARLN